MWVYMDDVVESGKPTGTVWVYMDDVVENQQALCGFTWMM